MKTIFETFKKSVHNSAFYQSVIGSSFSDAIRYYLKWSAILAVLMTIILGIFLVPHGVTFVKNRAPELVKSYYPSELIIHLEKGEASVNVPEPYIIPVKDGMRSYLREGGIENMLVIDTQHDFDKKQFEEYKTFALLTKTDLVTRDNAGRITMQDLSGVPAWSISQEMLLSFVEKAQGSLWSVVVVGLMLTLLLIFLGYIGFLIPLLAFALIPLVVAYIKNTPLAYGDAYKISLYAIIPALALKTLLNMVGILYVPSYFTFLVFTLLVVVNMHNMDNCSCESAH